MCKPLLATTLTLFLGLLSANAGLTEESLCVEPPEEEPCCCRDQECLCPCPPEVIPCIDAGPQAPRDVDRTLGSNPVTFAKAPPFQQTQLCDIHFHRLAEHKAAGFPTAPGEGEGYFCEGREPAAESAGEHHPGNGHCKGIQLGDSVEVHWVFTTCAVEPAPTLGSCFSPLCKNPQLRVEAKVFFLTDGYDGELDFATFASADDVALPAGEGAVEYLGSTTGPKFNNETSCSPFQVTWNVRPTCSPLRKETLDAWCKDNVFCEDHAHGVRELVTPLELRSGID